MGCRDIIDCRGLNVFTDFDGMEFNLRHGTSGVNDFSGQATHRSPPDLMYR